MKKVQVSKNKPIGRIVCPHCGNDRDFIEIAHDVVVTSHYVQNDDGSFTYTPDLNWSGTDTFTYEVTDGDLADSGEVTVEVKITPDGRFRAKAFNKSNNDYLYKSYAPYTQGVGVFYTQEYNRLSDLFKKKNKKDKQKKDKKPVEQSMLNQ